MESYLERISLGQMDRFNEKGFLSYLKEAKEDYLYALKAEDCLRNRPF